MESIERVAQIASAGFASLFPWVIPDDLSEISQHLYQLEDALNPGFPSLVTLESHLKFLCGFLHFVIASQALSTAGGCAV